jgi:choline dehydrogenase-like flavoprotein
VWAYQNLFINGSSLFPTVGYANPAWTIVALGLRLGDYLLRESKKS